MSDRPKHWHRMTTLEQVTWAYTQQIAKLEAENERLRKFVRGIYENFDCDAGGHKWNIYCRKCEAQILLDDLEKQ